MQYQSQLGRTGIQEGPPSGLPDLGKSHGISTRQGTTQDNPWGLRRERLSKAPFLCSGPIKSWEGMGGWATIQGLPRSPALHFIHHTLVLVGDEFQPGSIKTWAWTPRSRALKFQYGVISEVSSDDMKKTEVEKMRREHIYVNQMRVLIVLFLWKGIYLDNLLCIWKKNYIPTLYHT